MSESLSNIDKAIAHFEEARNRRQKEKRLELRPLEEDKLMQFLKDTPGFVLESSEDFTCAKIDDVIFQANISDDLIFSSISATFKTIKEKTVFKFFRVVSVEYRTKTLEKRSSIETVLKTHRAAQVCEAWLDCGIVPSKEQIEQMY
jgi:hypothetical protein